VREREREGERGRGGGRERERERNLGTRDTSRERVWQERRGRWGGLGEWESTPQAPITLQGHQNLTHTPPNPSPPLTLQVLFVVEENINRFISTAQDDLALYTHMYIYTYTHRERQTDRQTHTDKHMGHPQSRLRGAAAGGPPGRGGARLSMCAPFPHPATTGGRRSAPVGSRGPLGTARPP